MSYNVQAQTPVKGRKAAAQFGDHARCVLESSQSAESRSSRHARANHQAEQRLDEAEVPLSSELYANYSLFDDRNEPTTLIAPQRVMGRRWRAGSRTRASLGRKPISLVESQRATLPGANTTFMMDDTKTSGGIEFRQSLWRNSFWRGHPPGVEAQRAASRMNCSNAALISRILLIRAESLYWNLVSP